MTYSRIRAPFSKDEVQALNQYQSGTADGRATHYLGCISREDDNHGHESGDLGALIATEAGWVCPSCDYTQDWAHKHMVEFSKMPFHPHPWEKDTDAERVKQKLVKVGVLLNDYAEFKLNSPIANGVTQMIDCLKNRAAELRAKSNATGGLV